MPDMSNAFTGAPEFSASLAGTPVPWSLLELLLELVPKNAKYSLKIDCEEKKR